MAVDQKGRPAESTNGQANGRLTKRTQTSRRRQQTWSSQWFSISARLLVWFSIITILFRCPSSPVELTETSPALCKPYFEARSILVPYIEPYYNAYAAPYVDSVSPYVDRVEKQVVTPAVNLGKQTYQTHGAPRIEKTRKYGQQTWEEKVRPQIDMAAVKAWQQYDHLIAPHVEKASAIAEPYYTNAKTNVLHVYNSQLLPAYTLSVPYAQDSYERVHRFTLETVLPNAQKSWSSTVVFMNRTLWPKLRVLYGKNVEPQLVRIGERLGRYRDGRKIKGAVEKLESSSSLSSTSSTLSSISSSIVSAQPTDSTQSTSSQTSTASASSSLTPQQEEEQTRTKIESDLRTWQEKFAKAADKGTEDLEERVKEITERHEHQALYGMGQALLVQLEEASKGGVVGLKKRITSIVKSIPEGSASEDVEKANQDLLAAVRAAGSKIREKAQALRTWRQTYEQEVHSLVSAASDSTLDVIDNIRDLGLQEIGMRWAWMEGVTYKDWSKYHALKKTFDEWRDEVAGVAYNHPGLSKAKKAGEDVEADGMITAENAATELTRLKDVGKWKIQARDPSDDFDTKIIPAAAANVAQQVIGKASEASEAVIGTSQGTVESVASQATAKLGDAASAASVTVVGSKPGVEEKAASKISEAVVGTPQAAGESAVSVVKKQAMDASSKAAEAVVGTEPNIVEQATRRVAQAAGQQQQPMALSVVSAASKKVDQAASGASEAVKGSPAPAHESIISSVSQSVESAASAVSEAIPDQKISTPGSESASSVGSSVASSASSIASEASKKVWGGAMAQSVRERKIVYDDEDDSTYVEKAQKVLSDVEDKYADAVNAVRDALLKPVSSQGTAESVTSMATEQYSSALAAASSVLYGAQQGTADSAISIASGKYADAVAA
ncbi:MAG: hypothetical protein M1812_001128 [Candelaria pacifica]|nr:MAG: hypothetical protein M1812_001128 [Candelaria pacifica]